MQLAALQSLMSAEVASLLVTCSRYSLPVSSGLLRSSGRHRPSFFVKRTCSSSHELGSASEQMTNPNPPRLPKKQWQPPMEFRSSSRQQQSGSTNAEHPRSTVFRPQRFSRSRRLTPQITLRAYFISLPRAGFTFQGFSLPPSGTTSSAARALMTFPVHFLNSSEPENTRAAPAPPRL
jgi:hypothetical protein